MTSLSTLCSADWYDSYSAYAWFEKVKHSGHSFVVLFPSDFRIALYMSHSALLAVSDELAHPNKHGDFLEEVCEMVAKRLLSLNRLSDSLNVTLDHPSFSEVDGQRHCFALFAADVSHLASSRTDLYGGRDLVTLKALLERLTFILSSLARSHQ